MVILVLRFVVPVNIFYKGWKHRTLEFQSDTLSGSNVVCSGTQFSRIAEWAE